MKSAVLLVVLVSAVGLALAGQKEGFRTISFRSGDGLEITADLYQPHPDIAPFIVLFHQAGSSRGEYRKIAPELNSLGFNAMAVDLRSGEAFEGVKDETAERAGAEGKPTTYLDALGDMEAAIDYARERFARGKLLIWGSSYSAALALKIAGDSPDLVDGVLAFSPGEYFTDLGESSSFITASAKSITVPVFIASAADEKDRWFTIYKAVPSSQKEYFLPKTDGVHGSKTLTQASPAVREETWKAVKAFLARFLEK
jgi:dienelactone hydrolase